MVLFSQSQKGTTHLPAKTVPQEAQPVQTGSGVQLPPALASLFSGSSGTGLAIILDNYITNAH